MTMHLTGWAREQQAKKAGKRQKKRVRPKPARPGELPAPAVASNRPLESLALDVIARAARPVGRAELAKALGRRRSAVDEALELLWRRGRITWTTSGEALWTPPSQIPRTALPIL
jgi:hypothetical protein